MIAKEPDRRRGGRRDWVWPLLVAAVALAASVAGIRNQFTQDDLALIAQNSRIHDLANWREILTSPPIGAGAIASGGT